MYMNSFVVFFSKIYDVAADIEQFSSRFACGGYSDEQTIVFLAHPCIILSALEVRQFIAIPFYRLK